MANKKTKKEALEELKTPLVFKQTYEIPAELTDLEKIEAEMRTISPTLKDLKHNDSAKYKQVYRRYMWLVAEREKLL